MTPIPCCEYGYQQQFPGNNHSAKAKAWREEMVDMVRMVLKGEPVYVRYTTDKKRQGSIARITGFQNWNRILNPRTSAWYYRDPQEPLLTPETAGPEAVTVEGVYNLSPILKWDGRSNCTKPGGYELEWLKDYQGPTVWVYKDPDVPEVTATDRLGREIKVGDFCCYILHHFNSYGASTEFGTVTKITKDGKVFAKNVRLGGDEATAEKKINDNNTIVILTKDLMDQLMIAKLAAL